MIFWILTNPEDQGHDGSNRERYWFMFSHKETSTILYDPVLLYGRISEALRSVLRTTPKDYMVASPREVEIEAMRLAALRNIEYQAESTWQLASHNFERSDSGLV